MLENQLFVVQKPFSGEGMIQMDPKMLSKSSKPLRIMPKYKSSHNQTFTKQRKPQLRAKNM